MPTLQADYLVIGAGAVGMAFVDTIVAESDATVVMVDRAHQPGGHWTVAYPFVRLHQPSAYYGVNSRTLGSGRLDNNGWNAGLYELAGVDEIRAYYDAVMRDLLDSGQVTYFPLSEYRGERAFATVSGEEYGVEVLRRVVDTTHSGVVVPSMRRPEFDVEPGIACVPPNDLPRYARDRDRFVIVGGGKTGMDSALWLLRNGIGPERLTWIVPRESWLLDRANIQPGPDFADRLKAAFAARTRAATEATSVEDLFARLEAAGALLRLHSDVTPTMYRCATVTQAEADQLRRIADVVRLGHVQRIDHNGAMLDGGVLPAGTNTLWIDCSAGGLTGGPDTAVFDGERLTPQCVRACQQVFSAAFIAHVELSYDDDAVKNALCEPVPLPNRPRDWLIMSMIEQRNQVRWFSEPALMDWLDTSRLNAIRELFAPVMSRPRIRERALGAMTSVLQAAGEKMAALLASESSAYDDAAAMANR